MSNIVRENVKAESGVEIPAAAEPNPAKIFRNSE
jgi:hypothetical protein